MSASTEHPTPPGDPERSSADIDEARSFAVSEDWVATIVGLAIVALAAAGVVTADWIPL